MIKYYEKKEIDADYLTEYKKALCVGWKIN